MRLRTVAVIGSNVSVATQPLIAVAEAVGRILPQYFDALICGGKGGVMEAVCKGALETHPAFLTVGILPEETFHGANPYVRLVLPSGMGIGRNLLIIRSADVVIAMGGGAGTLSEIAFAWQLQKPLLCLVGYGGWSEKIANQPIDPRHQQKPQPFSSPEELKKLLENLQTRTT